MYFECISMLLIFFYYPDILYYLGRLIEPRYIITQTQYSWDEISKSGPKPAESVACFMDVINLNGCNTLRRKFKVPFLWCVLIYAKPLSYAFRSTKFKRLGKWGDSYNVFWRFKVETRVTYSVMIINWHYRVWAYVCVYVCFFP